jgi:hypothetical protein
LEEEGVLGDVTISSYNLQFIPIAEDVISLEHENAMRELWVVSEDFFFFLVKDNTPLVRMGTKL